MCLKSAGVTSCGCCGGVVGEAVGMLSLFAVAAVVEMLMLMMNVEDGGLDGSYMPLDILDRPLALIIAFLPSDSRTDTRRRRASAGMSHWHGMRGSTCNNGIPTKTSVDSLDLLEDSEIVQGISVLPRFPLATWPRLGIISVSDTGSISTCSTSGDCMNGTGSRPKRTSSRLTAQPMIPNQPRRTRDFRPTCQTSKSRYMSPSLQRLGFHRRRGCSSVARKIARPFDFGWFAMALTLSAAAGSCCNRNAT